jgi:hypothetical protein
MVFAAALAVTFTTLLPALAPLDAFVDVSPSAKVVPQGDARAVTVSSAGRMTIAGAAAPLELMPTEKGIKRRAARFTAVAAPGAASGDVLVFVDSEYEVTENGETGWLLDDMIAARVDKSGKLVWRQRLKNSSGDPTRHVFVTDKVIVLRERDGIEGVDVGTGKKVWGVDRDSLTSVLNDPHFWRATLDEKAGPSGTLLVGGRFPLSTEDGRRAFELELDVATGQRVFVKTPYPKPRAEPIYVRPPFRLEYPGDKAPPEVPTQWDGLRIRRSYLVWSKTTHEGLVIGPLATDASAIIAAAKGVRVKGAPVKWLYVVDLPAVGRAGGEAILQEGEALKAVALARLADPIVLSHDGAIERAGERIDVASVAKALGATAVSTWVPRPAQPKAGAIAVFRGEEGDRKVTYDHATHVCLQWGPYVFVDEHARDYRLEELPY